MSLVVTRGFGSGASVARVVTRGFLAAPATGAGAAAFSFTAAAGGQADGQAAGAANFSFTAAAASQALAVAHGSAAFTFTAAAVSQAVAVAHGAAAFSFTAAGAAVGDTGSGRAAFAFAAQGRRQLLAAYPPLLSRGDRTLSERLRRDHEILADIINSLLTSGQLVRTASGVWKIVPAP